MVLETLAQYQKARREGVTVCTSRDLAEALRHGRLGRSISPSTIVRLWDAMGLQPSRWRYWLEPTDPDWVAKSRAICWLYHHPPQDGTLLSFDEKPGIQVVER